MSRTFGFDLYIRTEKRKASVQRVLSALMLGVLAMLAIPVSASGGEPNASSITEGGIPTCATRCEALARFHRAKPVDDPVNGASSLAEAEFHVAKYGAEALADTARCEALVRFHRAKQVDDPANGASCLAEAEFYVDMYGADRAACTTWSEALARFHRAKPVDDPVNGAWSLAEAEFYVAKYGTDGAVSVILRDGARAFLCDAETSSVRR